MCFLRDLRGFLVAHAGDDLFEIMDLVILSHTVESVLLRRGVR